MIEADNTRLGEEAAGMIAALARISAEDGRITRYYLTPEHRRAADLVAGWMRGAGLEVSEDALGTVRGRTPGADGPRLLVGSHIDTVRDAGAYDGTFGVIAAILAAKHLMAGGQGLAVPVEILAFGDEESSRFPTALLGSNAVAGHVAPDVMQVASSDGVSLSDALTDYGKDPAAIGTVAISAAEALAYVEVHIEQGPVLEAQDEPLGVVTAIAGLDGLTVTVSGAAGHAGTVPMSLRRDPLAAAAEMMLAVEALASAGAGDGMVATVGQIEAWPGSTNVIPARARFTVDLRSMTDTVRREARTALRAGLTAIAGRRGVVLTIDETPEMPAAPCAPFLQDALAAAIEAGGRRPVRLMSGAGHDAQAMHRLCPVGMMFVRCRGGVSHNPEEYCAPEDMGAAVAALMRFIAGFRPAA